MTTEERLGRTLDPTRPPHGPVSAGARALLVFAGMAVLVLPYVVLCLFLLPWRALRLRLGNAVGAAAGRWTHRVVGLSHHVVGPAPETLAPAIFVQNHGGSLDLWLAMQLCPAPGSGTVKREIVWVPIIGLGYLLSGHLILDRGHTSKAVRAMRATAELVRRHRISVWILPEGTRSRDGTLGAFKKGFAHLALATRLPIVPVVVHRGHTFWPRGLRVRPGCVTIEVLPAMSTEDWALETLDAHVESVRARFVERLGEGAGAG